ncbi:MAG: hypothetical protein ABR563_05410 [Pyrinomonadaceae bacterium]
MTARRAAGDGAAPAVSARDWIGDSFADAFVNSVGLLLAAA